MSEDHGFAMLMGLLYLIGGCLLVPGFLMIIPESVTSFPVVNHTTGVVEKVVTFPNFYHYEYAVGIDLLLVGVGLILVGAVIDFCLNFCLKVKRAGFRNLWTPFAEFYHHESASRGIEDSPDKLERFAAEIRCMRERWGALLDTDPAYNPNLTAEFEDFSLAVPPRD